MANSRFCRFVKNAGLCYDGAGDWTMKRAETFWEALVLFLLVVLVIGIYSMVALAWTRLRSGDQVAASATVDQVNSTVQILAPIDGAVFQPSDPVVVRAAVTGPGFLRAELYVDGTKVAVEANPDPQQLPWVVEWAWDPHGEGTRVLTVQAFGQPEEWLVSAPVTLVVVPAGLLLFSSNRDGASAVYSLQTDGSDLTRLTTGPGDARQPASRADGVMAFVAETGAGQTMIREMALNGDGVSDLWVGRDPAWSPDGAHLAYAASPKGVSQVFVASSNDVTPTKLTAEEVYAGQPAWSADGKHLAYVAEQEGNWDLWVAGVDGSEPRRLTDDPGMDWAPAWSPDGSRLAFVSNRGGSHQIHVVRRDGTDIHRLTDFAQGAELPAWSPDGFWLALVAYTGHGTGVNARELYLVRADGQDQVRLTRNAFDDTEPEWARGP
jgi:Tol biopolymer transport system component